ncbi:MAG: ATP-binding cassette domain-containing protein [Egibacteraceae bacterium]
MNAPLLVAEGLARRYQTREGAIEAVAHADLEVRHREIIGISGRSGSGKSTLLRLLAGLEPPSAGQVRYLDPPRPGLVGAIFQDPVGALDARWPIGRSLAEPLTAPHRRRSPRQQRADTARAMLDRVGLDAVPLFAKPRRLSVGQLQRVVVARALLADPALLLADEPTSTLDVTNSAGILHLLAEAATSGIAIVIVSHDTAMLGTLCHRLLIMDRGRLTATGPQ